MKNFDIKTRINFGESALDRLEELETAKILVVADPFVIKSGLIDHIVSRLERAGKNYDTFDDVVPAFFCVPVIVQKVHYFKIAHVIYCGEELVCDI